MYSPKFLKSRKQSSSQVNRIKEGSLLARTVFSNAETDFLSNPPLPKLQKIKSSKSDYFKTEKQKKKELKNELKRLEEAEK